MRIFAGFLAVLVLIGGVLLTNYNKIPTLDEGVKEKWSQVQNQYKRRADLVPNLVSTVKGYAEHESATLQAVVEARSKATSTSLDVSSLEDPAKLKAFLEAQNSLSGALSRLMAITENYPALKANENFLSLQNQLEGTENRISVARKDYIEAVKEYNIALRTLPTSIVAKVLFPELKVRATFEANESEQNAPKVAF